MLNRNDADLIVPGIWLGNARASMDGLFLKNNKITAVFNCTKNLPFHSFPKNKYRLPVDDNLQKEEIRNMELWSYEIVYKVMKEHKSGNIILIHCAAGMQRSACVVAMYIIARYNVKTQDVIEFIRRKRPVAFTPFVNFSDAIQGFQASYEKLVLPTLLEET